MSQPDRRAEEASVHTLSDTVRLVFTAVRQRWVLIVSLAVVCGLAGVATASVATPRWHGQATLEIGRLGPWPTPSGTAGASTEFIEHPQLVTAVVRNAAFMQSLLSPAPAGGAGTEASTRLAGITLHATTVPGTGLVQLRAGGPTREQTAMVLEAAARAIIARHEALGRSVAINAVKLHLEAVKAEIAENERVLAVTAERTSIGGPIGDAPKRGGGGDSGSAIAAHVLDLRRQRLAAEMYLASGVRPARLAIDVRVSDEPARAYGVIVSLVALLGGALAGLVFALLAVPQAAVAGRPDVVAGQA